MLSIFTRYRRNIQSLDAYKMYKSFQENNIRKNI